MTSEDKLPLGYKSARDAVTLGRAEFFGSATSDLPRYRSALVARDDRIPQFGFVGAKFSHSRVLLLGINPGNGNYAKRSHPDSSMMPALHRFAADRSTSSFVEAQNAYKSVCESWSVWQRNCSEVIGAGKLSFEDIAYSNALPWRTANPSNFDDTVAQRAAKYYAYPLIEELRPRVVVAMGQKTAKLLERGGRSFPDLILIVWNCARVITPSVRAERAAAAYRIFQMVGFRAPPS